MMHVLGELVWTDTCLDNDGPFLTSFRKIKTTNHQKWEQAIFANHMYALRSQAKTQVLNI